MIHKIDNPLEQCLLKFANDDKGEFEGYASVFDGNDSVDDTITKGAFKDSIDKESPSMFINHDSFAIPVGDWISLKEDDTGLLVKGRIDFNHTDGRSLFSALKRKAMDALSVGFIIPKGGSEEKDNGGRIINKIDLKEISIVNFPADKSALISVVKAEIETIDSLKDAELFLRDSGVFSKSTATAFVSRMKDLVRCDTGAELNDEITELRSELQTKNATRSLVDFINNLGK